MSETVHCSSVYTMAFLLLEGVYRSIIGVALGSRFLRGMV